MGSITMIERRLHEKGTGKRSSGRIGPPTVVDLIVSERCFGSGVAVTLDVFGTANLLSGTLGGPPQLFDCAIRSIDGGPVRSSVGKPISVDGPLNEGTGEVVLVFGPGMADVQQVLVDVALPGGRTLASHLARAAASGAVLGASCSSTFLLAEAGVLDGGAATTSWFVTEGRGPPQAPGAHLASSTTGAVGSDPGERYRSSSPTGAVRRDRADPSFRGDMG
jgi:hypothetical protein